MSVSSGGKPPGKKRKENLPEDDTIIIQEEDDTPNQIMGNNELDCNGRETVSRNTIYSQNEPITVSQEKADRPFLLYKQTDKGPYHVYVENNAHDFSGKHCKSKPRCTKCFESHPTSTCTETIVKPQCFHCSESHYTYEIKKCDEFKRQQNIKKHMAITNCSYKDAERDIPKVTYAKIVRDSTTNNTDARTQNSQHNPHQETNTHFPTINNFPSTSRANSSSYFTQTLTKRPKRNISISPDPTEAERQKIISQPSISHREGGITSSSTYLAHIRGQCDEPLMNNVLELIKHMLEWRTLSDPAGSDHVPIVIKPSYTPEKIKTIEYRRWNVHKADWVKYQSYFKPSDPNFTYDLLLEDVNQSAEASIPKYIQNRERIKRGKPWWTEECNEAVQNRKDSFCIYQNNPNLVNLMNFKRLDAIAKKVIKKAAGADEKIDV
nr:unnamed protein product [Callosobruchus chinensis]